MSRFTKATNAALLILLGGALAFSARAQGPPPPPPLSWPPAPADIVNLRADAAPIPAAGPLRIFDVPGDRWLVVTDISATGSGTSGVQTFPNVPASLAEATATATTPKITTGFQAPYHSSGAVGLTFKPGSRVLADLDLTGWPSMTNKNVSYSIQGYLVTQP